MLSNLIPDLLVLSLLLVLLQRLARRHPESHARLWSLGMVLIFGEELAHLVYLTSSAPLVHHLAHATALNLYLLAGTTFVYAGMRSQMDPGNLARAILLNLPPRLVLLTFYGFDLRDTRLFESAAAFGIAAAIIAWIFWVPARRRYAIFMVLLWTGYLAAVHLHAFRFGSYWILFFAYTMAGYSFLRSLPSGSTGRLAVVFGFFTWALCFVTHAAAMAYPAALPFAEALWSLQKFVVAIGLLLVMLEEQVDRNRELALHDELTGLPNRRLFDDRLAQALLQGARNNTHTGLFVLDLNGFKRINDTFGHAAGDRALQAVSHSLQAVLRSSDTLARIGGDEFAIIVSNLKAPDLLLSLISGAVTTVAVPGLPPSAPSLAASIGLSLAPDDSNSPGTLLHLADQRMYQQKEHA